VFRKLLIANRGEVGARVLRTCKRMGIATVAIATDADADLQWLGEADEVIQLGDRRAYLDQDALLAAGAATQCSAVHPGWGFLSENPSFAARCSAARLRFIGPSSGAMRRMADKAQARETMRSLGLAPVPGGEGVLDGPDEALRFAQTHGFPVLLKAVAGGGGRGMRIVRSADQVEPAYAEASAEALGGFGDGRLYVERLIENARHIEFQVLGDGRSAIVLGERECSIQRRHQKLLEETPSPALSGESGQALRARIEAQIADVVGSLGYLGAGTVEMLLTPEGELYFMEMNTRLQVEHTVTEMVTGLDLVEAQLRIAANGPLPEVGVPTGHAIQCRINAEDVENHFQPTPGKLVRFRLPQGEGIRVDTHLSEGDSVSPHYDSLIAKVIAHGPDRATAIARMDAALADMEVEGVPTTIGLHRGILAHPDFQSGEISTAFLERELEQILS
jgi:acetyl-CoA carboxylase biotin carboxylase subunit